MEIYVGSLPFKLKEKELRDLFEQHGEVTEVKIVIHHITRQNKGFGFITMPNDTEAVAAIDALNGTELLDRTITVSKSEKIDKSKKRKNFGKGGINLKGGFDKTTKDFPGKSGHFRGTRGGRR